MASMALRWLASSILFIYFVVIVSVTSSYTTYYLDDYCYDGLSRTIQLESSGPHSSAIIRISRQGGYKSDLKCSLTVQPPYSGHDKSDDDEEDRAKRFGLVLSVDKINLRNRQGNFYCLDTFQVSHKDRRSWVTDLYGCWTNLTGKSVASDSSQDDPVLKLDFMSYPLVYPATPEYELEVTVTAYNLKTSSGCSKVSKDKDRFSCSFKERCIWEGLTCDLRNNCGDDSDETQANCDTVGKEVVIGVSVGLVGLVLMVLLCMICRWKRKRKPSARECHPTAPLLVPVGNHYQGPPPQSTTYGSSDVRNTQPPPPPYEYNAPYQPTPPPPPYKE